MFRCSFAGWMRVLAAVLTSAAPAVLRAQSFTPGALPIDVSITPSLIAPGASVTIAGGIAGYDRGGTVTITVTPPQRPALPLMATLGVDGKFTKRFSATDAPGKYAVRAVAPDGKGIDTDSFTVMSREAMVAFHTQTLERVFDLAGDARAAAAKIVASAPPSPPQKALHDSLMVLEQYIQLAPQIIVAYRDAIKQAVDTSKKYPDTDPVVDSLLHDANEVIIELAKGMGGLESQAAKMAKLTTLCDDLTMLQEGLTAFSWAMSFSTKPFKILQSVAISKGTPAAVNAIVGKVLPPAATAAITSALKVVAKIMAAGTTPQKAGTGTMSKSKLNLGPVAWGKLIVGVMTDIAQYTSKAVFDVYCERFEGPFTAKFDVDFNQSAQPWLKYGFQLRGKLQVNYAKGGSVGSTPVAGFLEGNASQYWMWEHVDLLLALMEPRYRTPPTLRLKVLPLASVPYVEGAGMVLRSATPGYFRVPVEGEIKGSKLTLRLKPAATDFSVSGKLVLIWLMSLPPFVHVEVATVPFQNGHFILTRGIQEAAPQFDVVVDEAAGHSVIEHVFQRDVKKTDADIRVQFEIKVKACNPGCL